jgi:uncharacterized protein YhfF
MQIPEHIAAFWREFAATQQADPTPRFYEAFFFDDNEASANALAQLALSGRKRATASLVWSHEQAGTPLPRPGSLSVVTTFAGAPVCVIETLRVDIVPFEEVTAEFAAVEGEGDGSLEYWRKAHTASFGRVCRGVGRTLEPRMLVACERFAVVYPRGESSDA